MTTATMLTYYGYMNIHKKYLTLAAIGAEFLLLLAVIGYAIHVLVVVQWTSTSIVGPLASVPLIIVGSLYRKQLIGAAWLGVAILILWGAAFLFSVGIPFLGIGILLTIPLIVITLVRRAELRSTSNQDLLE